jgi:type I restriction enzyme specificity protein hsdS
MDYLQQLLNNQPVEWKKLGEVCRIKNGRDYKHLGEGQVPVYGSGGIMKYVDEYVYDKPTVLIPRKGSLSNLFYVDTPFWNVDTIFYTEIDSNQICPKFLFHFLSTQKLEKLNMAGGVPSLTQTILNRLPIPIPPLSVQSRIVEILDKFTAMEAELQAELELRKKQYAYYREQLLNFSYTPPSEFNVVYKKLGEVAEIGTGRSNRKDEVTDGAYPFYVRSKNILRSSTYQFDETAIVIPGEGGIGDIFHYVVGKYALHQRAYRIRLQSEEQVLSKFLYYYMTSAFKGFIVSKSVGATATSIRKPMIEEFPIPLPPLSEQQRIVEILDKFDTLTNSISEGLPLEIQLRRQQYEYYREQLLDFRN